MGSHRDPHRLACEKPALFHNNRVLILGAGIEAETLIPSHLAPFPKLLKAHPHHILFEKEPALGTLFPSTKIAAHSK